MKKSQVELLPPPELYNIVFAEFAAWFKHEQHLDPERDSKNSLILNLGMFNLSSLNSDNGVELLKSYFAPKFNTAATARLRSLYAHLVAKCGKDNIDALIERTLAGIQDAHEVPMSTLKQLQNEIPTFWLMELMNTCFEASHA